MMRIGMKRKLLATQLFVTTIIGPLLVQAPAQAFAPFAIHDLGVQNRVALAGAVNDAGNATFWLTPAEVNGDPYGIPEQNILFDGSFNTTLPSLGGVVNLALDINSGGTVVGASSEPDRPFFTQAVRYVNDGIEKLNVGIGYSSIANAVNNQGQIAGSAFFDQSSSHAFLWNGPDDVIDIGTLGGTLSAATDINNHGVVVGTSELSAEFRGHSKGFIYKDGVLSTLDVFDAPSTFAHAINDQEQIVGTFGYSIGPLGDPEIHAFLLDPVNGPTDIGSPGLNSTAYDINGLGTVVGNAERIPDSSEERAFVYDSVYGMRFLEDLISPDSGWEKLYTARSINNRGQILGEGILNGELHVYLLTPTPEPSSLALAFIATTLIAGSTLRSSRA